MSEVAKKLPKRWADFARHFARHGIGAQAYREAGFTKSANKDSHMRCAINLLKKPEVQEEVERQQAILADQMRIDDRRVLTEVAAIAFLDPARVIEDGRPLPIEMMDEATRRSIKRFKMKAVKNIDADGHVIGETVDVDVEFHDKMRALDRIMEINGMLDKGNNGPSKVRVRIDNGESGDDV